MLLRTSSYRTQNLITESEVMVYSFDVLQSLQFNSDITSAKVSNYVSRTLLSDEYFFVIKDRIINAKFI